MNGLNTDIEIKQADVVLVQMPYTWLNPSLALGLLKSDLTGEGLSNEVIYASHKYVKAIGEELYEEADNMLEPYLSAWELLFAAFTDFTPQQRAEDVLRSISLKVDRMKARDGRIYKSEVYHEKVMELWNELVPRTERFLDDTADEILMRRPKIVGSSVMTQQRNASFALFKRLKERDPGVVTIMGGSCCTGGVAAAYAQRIPSLDYVFTGEGDGALGKGCRLIIDGKTERLKTEHPWFHVAGAPVVNRCLEDLNDSPIPDFSEYFEQVSRDEFANEKRWLVMESSRGCWWGQKGRCRFCGLHLSDESIHYRPKTDERIWSEAKELAARYGVNYILFADCILDHGFIKRLPEEAPDDRRHLRFVGECKSNMTDRDMRVLKHNGFIYLQPGIESLSDDMLKHMNKGAKVIDQLACLKYAKKYGVRLFWNLMYALPGEKASWYDDMIELMRHIHHFQPSTGFTCMMLVRNSVFYEDHDTYGVHTILAREIDRAADPDEEFSLRTANYLGSPDIERHEECYAGLSRAREEWIADSALKKSLIQTESDDCTIIRDTRYEFKKVFRLEGAMREMYALTQEIASEKKVFEVLGMTYSHEEIESACDFLCRNWLMYRKDGRMLALALPEQCEPFDSY
ncbi:MAG: RiPP maturation radical SAM C-methyltransferase [Lachnospiraceae bacterium]|nr:RiPP maturation radical SAM C-methyltransferase [Lachnospiraceae bacterium]